MPSYIFTAESSVFMADRYSVLYITEKALQKATAFFTSTQLLVGLMGSSSKRASISRKSVYNINNNASSQNQLWSKTQSVHTF